MGCGVHGDSSGRPDRVSVRGLSEKRDRLTDETAKRDAMTKTYIAFCDCEAGIRTE